MPVGRRIPHPSIDAIDDSREGFGPFPQEAVETIALLGSLNFPRVSRTDRGQRVGEYQAGFQQAQLPVKLQLSVIEVPPVQPSNRHIPTGKTTLIGQIVDREHRGDSRIPERMAVFNVQQRGNQAGLPVVAVKDIDVHVEEPGHFERCSGQQHEPLAVVRVVASALAIQPRPVEESRLLH